MNLDSLTSSPIWRAPNWFRAIWGTDLNGRYGILGQMTQYWRAPTIPHAFGVDDVAHNRILSGDYFIRA